MKQAEAAKIKGFNYQPSYGSNGFELWQYFSGETVDNELGLGKEFFPGMNAIRLWLSWDAFNRNPPLFEKDFETALAIAAKHNLVVMPVLFNRWHDAALDYGGIYIDHFLPASSWVQKEKMFDAFLQAVVGRHAADPRVFAWDLCNEPFSYGCPPGDIPDIARAEFQWLEGLYRQCKQLKAKAPITVGIHQCCERLKGITQIEPISDILSIHPYWTADSPPFAKDDYEKMLDEYAAFAAKAGKALIATETCWGSLDDAKRVEIIRYTLTQLKKRNIGWLAYLLHHSMIADAHRPEYGPVSTPGNLAFIEADDTLRPGHEVFNEF